LRSNCRGGYTASAHFRESVPAAGGAEIAVMVASALAAEQQSA
jgi:hypothetical protein